MKAPIPNRRRFKVTVENAIGDECDVFVDVRDDLNVLQYTGPAILKARRMLGMNEWEKPMKCRAWQEVAS